MKKRVLEIGLNRAKLISVKNGASVSKKSKAIFLSELASLGYKVDNPEMYNDSVLENFDEIIDTLREMKGGNVVYVPLFSGFPENVPDKEEFLRDRFVGFFGNILGCFDENDADVKVLENGIAIPNWLFDLTEFGADPIFGRQTSELLEQGKINQSSRKSDSHTEFTHLRFSEDIEGDVKTWLFNNMYAKSSIKEALKDDIQEMINHFSLIGLDPDKVVFKEIKAYVMNALWMREDYETLSKFISTPTDILRMFASLTDSDISLAEVIRFPKIRRKDRKFILSQLEKSSNLLENLNAYKGLWLNLGRYIHPGEYKSQYPKTFEAFDKLRNSKVETFNGSIEKFIEKRDINSVLKMIKQRPGIFGRKLHELIAISGGSENVISSFSEVAPQLELKNLLVLEKYFETINDSEYRAVINKKGKVIVLPNTRKGALSKETEETLLNVVRLAIKAKIKENPISFEEGTKIWIDPALKTYMVPLSLRKQSDGLMNISRGTRMKFDNTKILRLFSYWKESSYRTDFDTSLIEFDANMEYKGHVSYTNLSSSGIVHSGDITSAPHGAAEFIDIDMSKLKKDIKYLAIQVYKFAGESFSEVEASYTGWMIRDKASSDRKSFDIKTVANKFNMTGKGSYAIPMIVDVEAGEIVYVDLYMNGPNNLNRVEGAVNNVSAVAKEIVRMVDTKPNMHDLISYHVEFSNAELVENKEDATVTYGITDCTHSVDRVDEILSELL